MAIRMTIRRLHFNIIFLSMCLYPTDSIGLLHDMTQEIDFSDPTMRTGSISYHLAPQNASVEPATMIIYNLPSTVWIHLEHRPSSAASNRTGCGPIPYSLNNLTLQKFCISRTTIMDGISQGGKNITLKYPDSTISNLQQVNFEIVYKVENIHELRPELEEKMVDGTAAASGFLMSHSEFNFGAQLSQYRHATTNKLTMKIPTATTNLLIEFIHFNIGDETVSKCENQSGDGRGDKLLVYNTNQTDPLYHCYGGKTKPADTNLTITSKQEIVFRFESFSGTGRTDFNGFLLKYDIIACNSEIPHANITRQGSFQIAFIIQCSDNETVHEHFCRNGSWTGDPFCPPPPSTMRPDSGITDQSSTSASQETTSADRNSNFSVNHTTIWQSSSAPDISVTSSTGTMAEFKWTEMYTIVACAGGGGLLLIIIIILLSVLLCQRERRLRFSENIQGDAGIIMTVTAESLAGKCSDGSAGNVYHTLEDGQAVAGNGNARKSIYGDGYSTVDLDPDTNLPMIDQSTAADQTVDQTTTDTLAPEGGLIEDGLSPDPGMSLEVNHYANRETIEKQKSDAARNIAGDGNIYSSITGKNKTKKSSEHPAVTSAVDMVDNDLYSSGS